MAIKFPQSLDSFPVPNTNDPLSTPSHSALHEDIGKAIIAIEKKLGIDGSADNLSLDYIIKHIVGVPYSERLSGDGVKTEFDLEQIPVSSESVNIFNNGIRLAPTEDYTLNNKKIIFNEAPLLNDILMVSYNFKI